MGINMPSQQTSPIERIGTLLGVVKAGKDLYTDFANSAKQSDLESRYKDPNSAESKTARDLVSNLTGSPIADTVSRAQIEAQYGPVTALAQKSLDSKIQGNLEKQKIGWQGDKDLAVAKGKLDYEMQTNPNKFSFEKLPKENQEQVTEIAKSIANKQDVKNEMDSALQILKSPEVDADQKIKAGQNLLKVLNSTQGKDAVGTEEAKRLGSFLEQKFFNFTQPGSMFGRDLDQFTDQVALKSADLGASIDKNRQAIKGLYGQPDQSESVQVQIPTLVSKKGQKAQQSAGDAIAGGAGVPTMRDIQMAQKAKEALKVNPNDPQAKQVLQIAASKGVKVK